MADNFFALTRDLHNPVRRIKLSRDVQDSLTEAFSLAAARLVNPAVDQIPFDGSYKPDDDEVSFNEPFVMPEVILSAIREPATVEDLRLGLDAPDIRAIFSGNSDDAQSQVLFQQFQRTQFLTPKGISIILSGDTFKRLTDPGLNIGDEVHLIFRNKRLLFRSFFFARRILTLSDYYREATDKDLESFLAIPSIVFDDPASLQRNADTWVRRRVALIQDSGILRDHAPSAIRAAASAYNVWFETRNEGGQEVLVLPSDKKALKDALRFLDENYYQGPLSGKRYVTNSRRAI